MYRSSCRRHLMQCLINKSITSCRMLEAEEETVFFQMDETPVKFNELIHDHFPAQSLLVARGL